VRLVPAGNDAVLVSVRDEWVGLPASFDVIKNNRLGTRLVTALAKQLDATLTQPSVPAGVEFAFNVPLEP
jgi:two-component sensor histidine kinase